jgi:hypothetical protein
MKYSIKRFSSNPSPYSEDYENRSHEEFLEDIDSARRGKELQELDEEADRIRWRSNLSEHKSNKGKVAAFLGGPGGVMGKVAGDTAAEILDKSGSTDESIKKNSNIIGAIAGVASGLGIGYAVKRSIGDGPENEIKAIKSDLAHFEGYKKDVSAYAKMSQKEKLHLANEINARNQALKRAQRVSRVGKYAMPVLGIAGAIGAAKAVDSALTDRLARRKAIDQDLKKKKQISNEWKDFKRNLKSVITEDYRNDERDKPKKAKLSKYANNFKSVMTEDYKNDKKQNKKS